METVTGSEDSSRSFAPLAGTGEGVSVGEAGELAAESSEGISIVTGPSFAPTADFSTAG